MATLNGKNIALGVTGGIAAYKAAEIAGLFKKAGAAVFVVMTENACKFITPLTMETVSGNRAITDMFETGFERDVEHISLAKRADVFLIAPATANFIGKYALGIADDFLTTSVMAAKCPVIIAPAMNTAMLESAAVQKNIETLKNRGVLFIEPGDGLLACGDTGKGRLAEPGGIFGFTAEILNKKKDYKEKTVLITAGGTEEAIDPVRVITNRSSGTMGLRLAQNAWRRGAEVIFIYGNISGGVEKEIGPWENIRVTSTEEMYRAVMANLDKADVIIKAAAPADYTVKAEKNKIKAQTVTLTLTKTTDIAAEAGKIKGKKKLVVFAAETENLIANAEIKLVSKNADMVVANDITKEGAGFGSDTNIASFVTKNGAESLQKMTKAQLADKILDKILTL